MPQDLSALVAEFENQPEEELSFALGLALWESGYRETNAVIGLVRELLPNHYRGMARRWLFARTDQFRTAICSDFDYCGKKQRFHLDKIDLVGRIASVLLAARFPPTVAVITAILLVRDRLDAFCGCDSALPYFRQAVEDGVPVGRRRELLMEAVKHDPNFADAHYDLGVVEHQLGNTLSAEEYYRKAIALIPEHWQAMNNLAFLLAQADRDLDLAFELIRRARALRPTHPVLKDTFELIISKHAPR